MLPIEISQEVNQFLRWLRDSKPGGTYMYHRGLLIVDRQRMYYEHTAAGGRRPVLCWVEPSHTIGQLAMGAAATGLVVLTQHRRGEGDYAYVATRTTTVGDTTQPALIRAAIAASAPATAA